MTGPAHHHYAQAVANERLRDAQSRAEQSQLLAFAGHDHRFRRAISDVLLQMAARVAPRSMEVSRAPQTG